MAPQQRVTITISTTDPTTRASSTQTFRLSAEEFKAILVTTYLPRTLIEVKCPICGAEPGKQCAFRREDRSIPHAEQRAVLETLDQLVPHHLRGLGELPRVVEHLE